MKTDKEQVKGLLLELLPQPITSGKEMIAGDPPEVVVKLSDEGLVVAPYYAEWHGPDKLKLVVSDADLVDWNNLPDETVQLQAYLSQKIELARTTRKATYRTCAMCSEINPPECMHNDSTCQGCASDKLGIVY